MHLSVRTLLAVATTVGATLTVAAVAHAAPAPAGTSPAVAHSAAKTIPRGGTPDARPATVLATTTATKATNTAKPTAAAKTAKTTTTTTAAKTAKTTTATTAAMTAKTTTTTAGPALYRVQAGAARTRSTVNALRRTALKANPGAAFVVTGTTRNYRVVSACETAPAAAAIKATLTGAKIGSLVYRSQGC